MNITFEVPKITPKIAKRYIDVSSYGNYFHKTGHETIWSYTLGDDFAISNICAPSAGE